MTMMNVSIIKKLIQKEYQKTGNSWVKYSLLAQKCGEHGFDLNREFFYANSDFRICRTPNYNDFYVTVTDWLPHTKSANINPSLGQNTNKKTLKKTHHIKKRKTVDSIPVDFTPKHLEYPEDFKEALHNIVQLLTRDRDKEYTMKDELSQTFSRIYKQPIRSALRSYYPGVTLLDVLHRIDGIVIEKKENTWLIYLK